MSYKITQQRTSSESIPLSQQNLSPLIEQSRKRLSVLGSYRQSLLSEKATSSFRIFYKYIFSESLRVVEGKYVHGKYMDDWCRQQQEYLMTARESGRKHQKSTLFHGWIMWRLFRLHLLEQMLWEGCYLGYKSDLSEHHLKRVNLYISVNPWFEKKFVKTTDAETIVQYQANISGSDKKILRYKPEGMLSFKRGPHYNEVLVDDPLKDPSNALNLSTIIKITQAFNEEVLALPKEGGTLHVTGTRQDQHDLFWHLSANDAFQFFSCPAEVDPVNKITLWPELFDWDRLKSMQKSMGDKAYQKEMLCKPIRNLEGFFIDKDIEPIVGTDTNVDLNVPRETSNEVIGGFDIGKKRHPSHLVLFEKIHLGTDEDGFTIYRLEQIVSYWMDSWDYVRQIAFLKTIIDKLKVDRLLYDNTRGEFEGFYESGELPAQMEPIIFSSKSKRSMATALEKFVKGEFKNQRTLRLINDERQTRQILNCDNNLQSMETPEGHGDSFWSNAMACHLATEVEPRIRMI